MHLTKQIPNRAISVHTGSPGTTGASEATGGAPAYARKATTWGAASGGTITVTGQGLHVESLNLEDGRLVATGKVDSIVYDERQPKKGALRRILR